MKRNPLKGIEKTLLPMAVIALMLSCKGDKKAEPSVETTESGTAEMEAGESAGIAFEEDATQQVFASYLKLKDALVAGNPDAAKAAAADMGRVTGLENEIVTAEIEAFLSADGIDGQRASFLKLNEKLEPILRDHISEGAVYKQFCPMAFNDEGGFWFSDKEEIRNPYFGDRMLKCGKVEDKLVAL